MMDPPRQMAALEPDVFPHIQLPAQEIEAGKIGLEAIDEKPPAFPTHRTGAKVYLRVPGRIVRRRVRPPAAVVVGVEVENGKPAVSLFHSGEDPVHLVIEVVILLQGGRHDFGRWLALPDP